MFGFTMIQYPEQDEKTNKIPWGKHYDGHMINKSICFDDNIDWPYHHPQATFLPVERE